MNEPRLAWPWGSVTRYSTVATPITLPEESNAVLGELRTSSKLTALVSYYRRDVRGKKSGERVGAWWDCPGEARRVPS